MAPATSRIVPAGGRSPAFGRDASKRSSMSRRPFRMLWTAAPTQSTPCRLISSAIRAFLFAQTWANAGSLPSLAR